MAVIIPVVSKFDDRGLKKAQSEFGKLGSSMKNLLGAAGLTIGLSGVVSVLKESAQAAVGDVKSQALLANQLRNTVGASDAQVAAVEASIKAMQMQAAVADDDIRPAFASLVRATGDVTQATSLTSLALDVAAGTGKDLGAVSLALGKAVNGSTTSLLKLVPSIKGASNPMGELSKQFAGAAEEAANNDPFQRLTIVMGELQEQLGTYLLPTLEEFAGWLSDSSTQDSITWMIDQFGAWTKEMGLAADGVFYLGDQVDSFFKTISGSFESTPFTDFLGWLADRASSALNPLQNLVNILQQFGLLKKDADAIANGPKISKGLTANEKFLLGQSLKVKTDTTTTKTKPSTGDTQAEKAAKAAATKAAKARQAIIDAAQKASDEAKQAFDDLKAAVDDFNKSFAQTADAFKMVFAASAPLGQFEQQTVDAFQSMRDAAQAAFDAGLFGKQGGDATLANLKAYADREQALLQDIAKQRDVLAKKISIAESVTAGVMGSLNLTSMLETQTKTVTQSVTKMVDGIALTTTRSFDEVVTGGLADSFKKLVDKTKTFAGNLTKLKQLGLNGNLFKQIVEGGADAGGATAEAIIAGGADAVKELNGLFTELTDAGAEIAKTSTPVLYDLGENMTNSFIDGLRSQDQILIDTANSMAALFTEQFKSQLNLAITPTMQGAQSTAVQMQSALDLSSRPDPKRSPQSYAAWLQSIGGIDPMRSPESYARSQTAAGATYNVTINAGAIANKQELPAIIVDALGTYTKQSGAGGLTRVLGL
jgi:hypothetical protein